MLFIYLFILTDGSITKENPLFELFMLFDMCTPQYISTPYFWFKNSECLDLYRKGERKMEIKK